MESKFKIILSSVITLSIAVATSFVLTKCMLRGVESRITDNVNKNVMKKNKYVEVELNSIKKDVEKLGEKLGKIKDKVLKKDDDSLKNLLEAQSEGMQNAFSVLNEQVQCLTREIESNKKSDTVKTPDKDANRESKGDSEKSANKDSNEDSGNNKSGKSTGFLSFFGF